VFFELSYMLTWFIFIPHFFTLF